MLREQGEPIKRLKRGARYRLSSGTRGAAVTYWGSFRGPRRHRKYPEERFLVFRLEPPRFLR